MREESEREKVRAHFDEVALVGPLLQLFHVAVPPHQHLLTISVDPTGLSSVQQRV